MPEILYGRNPVLEALRAGRRLRRLLVAPGLSSDRRLEEIMDRATSAGVALETTPRGRLNDVAHTEHHQGIAGYFDGRQLDNSDSLQRLIDNQDGRWPPVLVCLDGVQDPQNLGSLARSAEVLGATALVLPRHRTATTVGRCGEGQCWGHRACSTGAGGQLGADPARARRPGGGSDRIGCRR